MYGQKNSHKNNAGWDRRNLKQFCNVLPLFCSFCILAFLMCVIAKCISLDLFVKLLVCFSRGWTFRQGKILHSYQGQRETGQPGQFLSSALLLEHCMGHLSLPLTDWDCKCKETVLLQTMDHNLNSYKLLWVSFPPSIWTVANLRYFSERRWRLWECCPS